MELSIEQHDGGARVTLSGQFTFTDNVKFRDVIDLVHAHGMRFLEMDFNAVNFIDSAGLGMLLMLRDNCQTKHVPISLHSPHGQVAKIFTISKFDQLFSIRL